jgi:Putative restriction endonuclease
MGLPPEKPRRATYADLEAADPLLIAELAAGVLYTSRRLPPRLSVACMRLFAALSVPFEERHGGPGGWIFFKAVELHVPDPTEAGAIDALVPDISAWTRARLPAVPDAAAMTLAPDWICEVLSESTAELDRAVKMPIYAREGVRHAWLVDPAAKTLEVYTLAADGRWSEPERYSGADVVRAAPFDAVGLELPALET